VTETPEQATARYRAAAHAMQSGVAMKMNHDGGPQRGETSPKHLRVGVNSAMVEHSALVRLLMAKGVITEDEYLTALADAMEAEKRLYETELRDHIGNEGIALA
jgi:hypothetical protein